MSRRAQFWGGLSAVVLALLLSVAALALMARHSGTGLVAQAVERNSTAIATALRIQFEKAFSVGMQLQDLVGVDEVFEDYLERHQEVSFFALLDAQNKPLLFVPAARVGGAQTGKIQQVLDSQAATWPKQQLPFDVTRTPIVYPGSELVAGTLLTGFPNNYIDQQVNAMVLDLFVAVLIAMILVAEFMRYLGLRFALHDLVAFRGFAQRVSAGVLNVRSHLNGPSALHRIGHAMDQRLDAIKAHHQRLWQAAQPASPLHTRLAEWGHTHQLNTTTASGTQLGITAHLRLMVFLTALSDEMIRPFFAVHITTLDSPVSLSNEVLAGIPLTTFLLTWAFSQPFGAGLLQRFGAGRCLASASAVVGLGLLATAFTTNWWLVTALRAATGLGFGFMLIFTQTLLLRLGRHTGRAKAIAEFVGAVVAAGICGPVVGGLVADKLGTPGALMVAGATALAAWVLAWNVQVPADSEPVGSSLSVKSLVATLTNFRLLALLVFSSIPGKLVATAVLLMVVPMTVADMGESPALAGRLLLLYFLGFLLVSGLAGRLSDRWRARKPFVVVGGLLTAAGCVAGYAAGGIWGLALLCALTGLGQAWLSSPQIVLATQLANQNTSGVNAEVVLGIYRLLERFGGAMGPVVAAHLIQRHQLTDTLWILGVCMSTCTLLTLVSFGWPTSQPRSAADSSAHSGTRSSQAAS